MSTFGIVGKEFINLYDAENPILKIGSVCNFIFHNLVDYHMPLIGTGLVIDDKFTDGMSKKYYIKLLSIDETPAIINEFVIKKQFIVYPFIDNVMLNKKLTQVELNFNWETNLLGIDCFFVRNSLEKIKEHRNEYIKKLREDIQKQITDIDRIIY